MQNERTSASWIRPPLMDQASSNGERRRGVLRTSLRSTEASPRDAFHTPSSPARTTIALESSRPLRCPKHRSNTRVAYKEDAAGVVEGPRRDEPPTPIVEVRIDKHLLTECFPRHVCRRGIPAVGGTTPLMKKQSSCTSGTKALAARAKPYTSVASQAMNRVVQ